MSQVKAINLAEIMVPDGRRGVSEDHAAGIAATIEKNAAIGVGHEGLEDPIKVRQKSAEEGTGYVLISGEQRLAAHQLLKRDWIAAIAYSVTEIEARRLAIEENLIRYDLTALDKALHVAEYREIHEAEYGAVSAGRPDNSTKMVPLWSEAVLEKFGIGKNASSRHLRIANGLRPEIRDMLRGTGWDDNQKALLELAAVPVEKQKIVLNILFDEEVAASSMRDAIAMLEGAKEQGSQDEALKKWFGVAQLHKTEQLRVGREWMAKRPEVFEELLAERGFTITLKVK